MNTIFERHLVVIASLISIALLVICPSTLRAQIVASGAQFDPDAQRNDMQNIQIQTRSLINACNTASDDASDPYQFVLYNFNSLRAQYNLFKNSLSSTQLSNGANEWAELDSGLTVLAEAFTDYQEQTPPGTLNIDAFRNMCEVLGQAAGVWLQEFTADCARAQVGW